MDRGIGNEAIFEILTQLLNMNLSFYRKSKVAMGKYKQLTEFLGILKDGWVLKEVRLFLGGGCS